MAVNRTNSGIDPTACEATVSRRSCVEAGGPRCASCTDRCGAGRPVARRRDPGRGVRPRHGFGSQVRRSERHRGARRAQAGAPRAAAVARGWGTRTRAASRNRERRGDRRLPPPRRAARDDTRPTIAERVAALRDRLVDGLARPRSTAYASSSHRVAPRRRQRAHFGFPGRSPRSFSSSSTRRASRPRRARRVRAVPSNRVMCSSRWGSRQRGARRWCASRSAGRRPRKRVDHALDGHARGGRRRLARSTDRRGSESLEDWCHAGASSDVGRGRLFGGGCVVGRCRPRGGRGDDEAVGRAERFGLLFGRGRDRCATGL